VGGAIGDMMLAKSAHGTGNVALPPLVGLGSAISSCLSFAALAVMGIVVLGEIVGEEKEWRPGRGVGAIIGGALEKCAEAVCGGIWGAVCGLLIGVLVFAIDAFVGLPRSGPLDTVFAGAMGGLVLAAVFAGLV